MSPADRYYVTTAIAYANNRPGLHTLYEVIGADVIARWHRMKGDDTRFLTGTDEHSVNIAQKAAELGKSTKDFVDENVALFRAAEDALLISPDRFIRTTDPDHVHAAQEMVRRAYANGDIYVGDYEGWYCPAEGFKAPSRRDRDSRRYALPEPPDGAASVAIGAQLVLPPVGLPGAAGALLRGAPRLRPAGLPAQRDARLHSRRARGLLDQPSRGDMGHPVPDHARRLLLAAARRNVGSGGRHRLRLVRRAHQLRHRRRLPRRPGRVRSAGGRPTCTSSARTSPASTRSTGRRCCGAPAWRRLATSGSTAGCSPRASG